MQDPDAPGGTYTHWIITGIDPRRTSLAEGERPPGAREGRAGDGKDHYAGPCPPAGKPHHYRFTVYALKRATGPNIDAIVANAASQGRLVGTFAKP
jgi:Raf kinase inhibitor-like YbhB/YbcL family protein